VLLCVHDEPPELAKSLALKRLCKEIADHILGWAVFQGHFSGPDLILDEEIPDLDVPGSFCT